MGDPLTISNHQVTTHGLYWTILRPHRRAAVLVTTTAIAAGMLEALGLAALLPVLGRPGSSSQGLYTSFVILGTLLVSSVSVRAVADLKLAGLNVAIETRLRRQFLDSLIDTRWSALRDARSGDLVTALMSESSQVANGATAYLGALTAFCIAVCLAVVALTVAPLVSVVVMAFAVLSFFAYRRAGQVSRRNQSALAIAAAEMNEDAIGLLGNLKMLLATGDRTTWLARMQVKLTELMVLRRSDLAIPVITRSVAEGMGAALLVSAMALTVLAGGNASAALVTLAIFYRLVPRLQTAQSSFLVARTQSAWWERWQERERIWFEASDRERQTGRLHFESPLQEIEIADVKVVYPGRAASALHGVSLRLQPGSVLAVVGHTGSGKSTLIDVLTGLITPTGGSCSVNSHSLVDLDLDSWQRHIGFVPQEAPVLHATLLENLVWLEENVDREWAAHVVQVAALDDFVASLPAGLDTVVGPRGASISGGQRQRLAIARAIYRRPSLLILDEATSGLDGATEQRLLTNLISHCHDTAVVIVTHRLDTVALADDVIVLEEGRMAARGLTDSDTAAALARISASKAPADLA